MKWLGFDQIRKQDDEPKNSKILEEDIQIELENGLLIIECKGIGGTSTDSDCSQISKIKHRRCKDRNRFDVYALYIVNHQRYLPPLHRANPPFSDIQIQEAENDERGLLSTWQLFNLYHDIEAGILSKAEVRKMFLAYGLVTFRPLDLILVDEPKEFFKDGRVCIVTLSNIEIKLGDEVLIERDGQFERMMIEGIQLNDNPVTSVTNGEVGISLNNSIRKKSKIWLRSS
ncbi:MAG: hypothetical protein RIA69_15610 [Cyclobacteriaceae bacterium]